MQIEVTAKIDAMEPMEKALSVCWAQMFERPKHGDTGGPGWEAVRRQVLRYIESLDLTAEIELAAISKLPALVDEAVSAALSAAIKKRAAAMQAAGQLARVV